MMFELLNTPAVQKCLGEEIIIDNGSENLIKIEMLDDVCDVCHSSL